MPRTLAVAVLWLHASGAIAQNVFCSVQSDKNRIEGNLDIATACELTGTEIRGNVTLFAGGSLTATDVRIRGDLVGRRADFVSLSASRVEGELRLEELVGDSTRIERTDIRRGIVLLGNRSRLEILGNELKEGMQARDNSGGLLIVSNTIKGTLACVGNAPAPLGADNRVSEGDIVGQCVDLSLEAPPGAPAPAPSPPATPVPPVAVPPAAGTPPVAAPPATPTTPPTTFVPDLEGGGGGAIGLWWVGLVPLVVARAVRRRRGQASRDCSSAVSSP